MPATIENVKRSYDTHFGQPSPTRFRSLKEIRNRNDALAVDLDDIAPILAAANSIVSGDYFHERDSHIEFLPEKYRVITAMTVYDYWKQEIMKVDPKLRAGCDLNTWVSHFFSLLPHEDAFIAIRNYPTSERQPIFDNCIQATWQAFYMKTLAWIRANPPVYTEERTSR